MSICIRRRSPFCIVQLSGGDSSEFEEKESLDREKLRPCVILRILNSLKYRQHANATAFGERPMKAIFKTIGHPYVAQK
jgi:hypothetical protein